MPPAGATLGSVGHRTLAKRVEHEERVKGSRFLAVVAPVAEVAAAHGLVETARAEHAGANHHCWAYRVGDQQRFSDDGEPGGTAGRPMLEVFLKRDLDYVAAVVTRYFGGRKLGAGGLVRAYSAAVARAADAAGIREVADRVRLELRAPFEHVDSLLRWLDGRAGVRRGAPAYGADGLQLELDLLEAERAALEAELAALTRGSGRLAPIADHAASGPG